MEPDAVVEGLTAWAQGQPLVRAALLTSSRANPAGQVDLLSDHDVILCVSDTGPFVREEAWLREFGAVLVQFRDERDRRGIRTYARLVLYEDGTKIDFTIAPVAFLERIVGEPRLPPELDVGYRVLVDKDALAGALRAPAYTAYIPAKPAADEFASLVEEFWWETTYVAKNLWRDELLPAKHSLDGVMKLELVRRMLEWSIEIDHGWTVRPGVSGRHLKRRLPPATWSALEQTYAGASIDDNWDALFRTCDLFRDVARRVAAHLGYDYDEALDERVTRYLVKVRGLDLA